MFAEAADRAPGEKRGRAGYTPGRIAACTAGDICIRCSIGPEAIGRGRAWETSGRAAAVKRWASGGAGRLTAGLGRTGARFIGFGSGAVRMSKVAVRFGRSNGTRGAALETGDTGRDAAGLVAAVEMPLDRKICRACIRAAGVEKMPSP